MLGAGAAIGFYRNRSIDDKVFEIVMSSVFSDDMLSIDYFNWDNPGHIFLYWNTQADGSGTIVNPGDEHIPFSNYYAIWEEVYLTTTTELTDVADAIRTKSNTSAKLEWPSEYIEAINNISGGSTVSSASAKAVNFRDYDGKIVYSYTAEEFAALSAMPANPDHSSDEIPLTSQGWNWSLTDAQTYVAKYGRLEVGQMYITMDGKTHILIHLEKGRTSPMLGCCPNGTVDVDWGDGTAHDTLTGTSVTTVQWTPTHNYAAPGDYDIKLTCTGTMGFYGSGSDYQYNGLLLRYSSSEDDRNSVYQSAIREVFCTDSVTSIEQYAFSSCHSLSSMTIPDSVTSIGNGAFNFCNGLSSMTIPTSVTNISSSAFQSCHNLSSVAIPNSVTSVGNGAFQNCSTLSSVSIPDSVTNIEQYALGYCSILSSVTIPDSVISIGDGMFNGCSGLSSITIPNDVTSIEQYAFGNCSILTNMTIPNNVISIGSGAFSYCSGLGEIHFLPIAPPTVANANAFSNLPTDCKIYVPTGSLEAYTTATNYPSSSTYTYIEE